MSLGALLCGLPGQVQQGIRVLASLSKLVPRVRPQARTQSSDRLLVDIVVVLATG